MSNQLYNPDSVSQQRLRHEDVWQSLYRHIDFLLGDEPKSACARACWDDRLIEGIDFAAVSDSVLTHFSAHNPAFASKEFPDPDSRRYFGAGLLSFVVARGATFRRCNFSGLSMLQADFSKSDFIDCNLQGTFEGGYKLDGARLFAPQLTLDARIVFFDLGAIRQIENESFHDFAGHRLHGIHLNDMRQVVYSPTIRDSWKNLREHNAFAGEAYRTFLDCTQVLAHGFGQKQSRIAAIKRIFLPNSPE